MQEFDATDTANRLPYPALAEGIATMLLRWQNGLVHVPERTILDLPNGGKLLVMPASDDRLTITKLVTVQPRNPALGLPTILGEVIAMRSETGERLGMLDGATVTARRTAALSLLAVQRLAPVPAGPLLMIGAGVQARAHVEAFHAGLGVKRVFLTSRTRSRAEALASHARSLGMDASVIGAPPEALAEAKLVVAATTSTNPVLDAKLEENVMVCAVGSFQPDMAELSPTLIARSTVVVDTLEAARQEAGDLIQAVRGNVWSWQQARPLNQFLVSPSQRPRGPVVFKSVGHALFDLAAAELAFKHSLSKE